MAAVVVGRYWMVCGTLDEWLDHAFLFGEVAVGVLSFMADPWMLVRYVVGVLLVWVLAPYPDAELPSDVRQLSTHELWARVAWETPELHPKNLAGLQVDEHAKRASASGGSSSSSSASPGEAPALLTEEAKRALDGLR